MAVTTRLITLVLILIIFHASYAFIRSGTPQKVRPPKRDLNDLPLQLGDWTATTETHAAPGTDGAAGEDISVRRMYSRSDKQVSILTYLASWTNYRGPGLPKFQHDPHDCYRSSGHSLVESSEVTLTSPSGLTARAAFMHTTFDDQPVYILFWYQLDQDSVHKPSQMQVSRWEWSYMGEQTWPPLIKVMLEVRGTDPRNAKRLLSDLGTEVYNWTAKGL